MFGMGGGKRGAGFVGSGLQGLRLLGGFVICPCSGDLFVWREKRTLPPGPARLGKGSSGKEA